MDRRTFLATSATLWWAMAPSALARAADPPRLVLLLLRGGLDGLSAVPPHGDPGLALLRPAIGETVALNHSFSLHAGLAPLEPLWRQRELAIVHATCVPYADRSHFDAQNVLETGAETPFALRTGWLARALDGGAPLAIGPRLPLVLRGPAAASSYVPGRELPPDEAWLDTLASLYAGEPAFAEALSRGRDTAARFARHAGGAGEAAAMRALGAVLAEDGGPTVAVAEIDGFDTHTGQEGRLAARLPALAEAILGLRDGLGDAWSRTIVVAASEFGRTARWNGTDGTDHGVGGAAFLAGGAVDGGRVIADWPGLSERDLVDGRDLAPTTDLRAVFKAVLSDHLQVPSGVVERDAFPNSGSVRPLRGLVR